MKNSCGYTLIEILVGTAMLSVALAGLMFVLQMQTDRITMIQKNQAQRDDEVDILKRVRKVMAETGFRLFAMEGAQTYSLRVPIADRCADLATTCAENTALLFGGLSPRAAVVSIPCIVTDPTAPLTPFFRVIIDLTNNAFQTYNVSGNSVEILSGAGMSMGTVTFNVDSLSAMIDGDRGVLVEATSGLRAISPLAPEILANGECTTFTTSTSRLFEMTARARLFPNQSSSAPAPTATQALLAFGKMPLRLAPATIYSLGKNAAGNGATLFECDPSSNRNFSCTRQIAAGTEVNRMDIRGVTDRVMTGATHTSFGYHNSSCGNATGCLRLNYPRPVPGALPGEVSGVLNGSSFSLRKLEYLRGLSMTMEFNQNAEIKKREFSIGFM